MSAMYSGNMKTVMHHSLSTGDLTASQKAAARKNYLRTRNEGSLYQKRAMEGSMKDILAQLPPPAYKARPKSSTQKQEPRNFAKDNIKRIRQMSIDKQQTAEAEDSTKKPLRVAWAEGSQQRQTVNGKDSNSSHALLRENGPYAPPSRSKSIQSGLNSKEVEDTPAFKPPIDPTTRRKSLAEAMTSGTKNSTKNYVELNKTTVTAAKPGRAVSASGAGSIPSRNGPTHSIHVVELDDVPKAKAGVLPSYMAERRHLENVAAEWVKEAKKHNLPPGSHLMPETERVQLLAELEEAKRKKEREMFMLPLRSDTLRAQRKRESLEVSLREIDEGLSVLSKPLVIVQDSLPHPIKVPQGEKSTVDVLPLERKHRPTWNGGDTDTAKPLLVRPASEKKLGGKSGTSKMKNASDKRNP